MRREPIMSGTASCRAAHHGRGGHHHHDRAVLAHDGDVGAGAEHVVGRAQQLGADEHGQQAAGEEEQEDADRVLPTRPPCGRRSCGSSAPRSSRAGRARARSRGSWPAGSSARRCRAIHPTTPNTARARWRRRSDRRRPRPVVAAGDDVAEPVADEIADHAAGHGPQDVGSQPGRAAPRPGDAWRVPTSSSPGYSNSSASVVSMAMAVHPRLGKRVALARRAVALMSTAPFGCGAPYVSTFEYGSTLSG